MTGVWRNQVRSANQASGVVWVPRLKELIPGPYSNVLEDEFFFFNEQKMSLLFDYLIFGVCLFEAI